MDDQVTRIEASEAGESDIEVGPRVKINIRKLGTGVFTYSVSIHEGAEQEEVDRIGDMVWAQIQLIEGRVNNKVSASSDIVPVRGNISGWPNGNSRTTTMSRRVR